MGVRETLMAHGRKLALLLAGCAFGGCTGAPSPRPSTNGLVVEVSPPGPAPVFPTLAPATLHEDGLAAAGGRHDPDDRLASLDDPNDPIWPGALAVLLKAQAGGLPIYTAILSAPNLSPRVVERAAATGELSNFGKGPGSSFLGTVGEAIIAQTLLATSGGIPGSTVTFQPPKSSLPAGITGFPDLAVGQVGIAIYLGVVRVWRQTVDWVNTVGPRTGGLVGVEHLGANVVVSIWEVTTSTQFQHIFSRGRKVAAWAAVLGGSAATAGAAASENTPVKAAVLAMDRGTYFGLQPGDRMNLVNTVTGAGGFIRLYRDLTANATRQAITLHLQLAPVSRP